MYMAHYVLNDCLGRTLTWINLYRTINQFLFDLLTYCIHSTTILTFRTVPTRSTWSNCFTHLGSLLAAYAVLHPPHSKNPASKSGFLHNGESDKSDSQFPHILGLEISPIWPKRSEVLELDNSISPISTNLDSSIMWSLPLELGQSDKWAISNT